jgi:CubicO group peptidase (beta-lactamase class C family)
MNTSISTSSTWIRSLAAGAARRGTAVALIMLALLAFAATRPATAAAASTPRASTPDLAAIDRYVEAQRRATRLPGLALGIVHGDRIVHLRGFGHADSSGRLVTPQTPFILASTTKSFTALAIMQLVEAGKVDLDAPVQRYLPWFHLADPAASARITIRHLLNQTSGLADPSSSLIKADSSDAALEHAVRALSTVQPTHPPGQAFGYANMNYVTLGLIVQTLAGQSYEDYMRQHVLAPLGMTNSYPSLREARQHGLATGSRYWFGHPVAFQLPDSRAAAPAGYISASAEAMSHYLIAHLNAGRSGAARVLSPAGIAELHRPAVKLSGPDRDIAYAMGWYVEHANGVSMLWHPGNAPNFHADILLAPQSRWGVVVLTNGHNGLSPDRETAIARGVLGLLVGRQLTTPPVTNANQILFSILLGAGVLQALGIARSIGLLRRWRAQPARRPHGLTGVAGRIVVPLMVNLAWALVCLVGLPMLLGGSLSVLLLTTPDFAVVAVASGIVAAAWSILRAILAVRTIRRHHAEPAVPDGRNPADGHHRRQGQHLLGRAAPGRQSTGARRTAAAPTPTPAGSA